jgi:hypothetical protein
MLKLYQQLIKNIVNIVLTTIKVYLYLQKLKLLLI